MFVVLPLSFDYNLVKKDGHDDNMIYGAQRCPLYLLDQLSVMVTREATMGIGHGL